MSANHNEVEQRLWEAADQLRANSNLRASEYSAPVLGLIFMRYADHKFTRAERELIGKSSGRRTIGKLDYQARGVMFLPEEARFQTLLDLPGNQKLGAAIDGAMRSIEVENEELKGVLPKTYSRFDNEILDSLLRTLNSLPMNIEGDAFGLDSRRAAIASRVTAQRIQYAVRLGMGFEKDAAKLQPRRDHEHH